METMLRPYGRRIHWIKTSNRPFRLTAIFMTKLESIITQSLFVVV